MSTDAGSGGFRPSLVTEGQGVTAQASFLASEHMMVKRAGITMDATQVAADGNGDKPVKAGTLVGRITASGKYRPYLNASADGSETAVGILMEAINLRKGDVICGLLMHGSVLSARCTGLDAPAQVDLAGRIVFQ